MKPRVEDLLRDAAAWRLLGLLFECPTPPWREQVQSLAKEIPDERLKVVAQRACAEATEGDYHSILGPGGPAPAREVSYHDTLQLGYLVSELTSYYDAFAYRPMTEEALDHISVEAGFVGYLRLKEAFALSAGDSDAAGLAADAAKAFIGDHLSYLAQPLAASLSESGVEYLSLAGQVLLARVGPCRTLPVIANLAGEAFCTEAGFECGA